MPPTTASASYSRWVPLPCSASFTATVASTLPGAPEPLARNVNDVGASWSARVTRPSYVPLIEATPAVTVMA